MHNIFMPQKGIKQVLSSLRKLLLLLLYLNWSTCQGQSRTCQLLIYKQGVICQKWYKTGLGKYESATQIITSAVRQSKYRNIKLKQVNFVWQKLCYSLLSNEIVFLLSVGAYIGPTLGMIASGMLNHHWGWQYIFYFHGNDGRSVYLTWAKDDYIPSISFHSKQLINIGHC